MDVGDGEIWGAAWIDFHLWRKFFPNSWPILARTLLIFRTFSSIAGGAAAPSTPFSYAYELSLHSFLESLIQSTICANTFEVIDCCGRDDGEQFLPRSTAIFNQILVESLKIRNASLMHLDKKFIAAIFSAMVYQSSRPILISVVYLSCVHFTTFSVV